MSRPGPSRPVVFLRDEPSTNCHSTHYRVGGGHPKHPASSYQQQHQHQQQQQHQDPKASKKSPFTPRDSPRPNHFIRRKREAHAMSALRPNQREKAAAKNGSAAASGGLNGIVNGLVDPTKTGKYPVILSDTLLGATQKDVFTGVKYNHKPQLSSDSAPSIARLKPETPGDKTNFDLSFTDDGGKYGYAGTRTTDQSQYVLYFDPERKAFILDKLDSTFNMNITRTPDNTDPHSLSEQFQHLDTSTPTEKRATANDKSAPSKAASASTSAAKPKASSLKSSSNPNAPKASRNTKQPAAAAAPEKKKESKSVGIALPPALPTGAPPLPTKKDTTKKRRHAPEDDEDEDEDEDDGLQIEYPDAPKGGAGGNRSRGADFSPAFQAKGGITMRRFSEFLRDSEADDADGESELEEEEFKLSSPEFQNQQKHGHHQEEDHDDEEDEDEDPDLYEDVTAPAAASTTYRQQDDDRHQQQHQQETRQDPMEVDSHGQAESTAGMDDFDLEDELEKALEAEGLGDSNGGGDESEVSEED